MSGHLNLYKYYCVTENKWISEERNNTDSAPTQCKNDSSHTIKTDSIHIAFRGYHEGRFFGYAGPLGLPGGVPL